MYAIRSYYALELHFAAQAALLHFLGHEQGHGGGGAQRGRAEIGQNLHLDVQHAGSDRQGHGPEMFAAELKARSRRPQAVAHADLDAVELGAARQSYNFV